ncbi:hypothetical protein MsAg5_04000 [Methanosarcinaceae archaeon Ag5]|uniref:Uncharacterized protein n=1 Tax=Methanolapillus africanus TaxID=3028297 RepID=A0AAE4MIR6_9EURY|nr:hypothetical protein [Methanosarcinaceae archaeon Ag5]
MKPNQLFVLLFALSVLLIFLATFHVSATVQTDIDVKEMTMTFHDTGATAEIHYEIGLLTHIYTFFFGSRNLDPYISDFLVSFPDYRIVSIGSESATIELYNVTRTSNNYYLHDAHQLGSTVDLLVLVYPNGQTKTYENVSETPNTFYER